MANLTSKQEAFVREYAIDKNATQAAVRAGYSKKTAYSIGQENLKNLKLQRHWPRAKKAMQNDAM